MALSKTARTVVASASNAAGATTRGKINLVSAYGGLLTIKMTNGATPPTVQCTCNVLVAHDNTDPAAGSAGTVWKTIWTFGGGTTASAVTEQPLSIDPSVMALCVEFTGNTGQAVTVESGLSELTTI